MVSQSISGAVRLHQHVKVNHEGHKGTTKTHFKVLIKWDQRKNDCRETEKPADLFKVEYRGPIEALVASNTREQSYALSTNKMVTGPPLLLSLTDSLTSLTSKPLE